MSGANKPLHFATRASMLVLKQQCCRNLGVKRVWITPTYSRYRPNTAITIIIASAPCVGDQTNLRRGRCARLKHVAHLVGAQENIRKPESQDLLNPPAGYIADETTSEFQVLAQIDKALRGEPDSTTISGLCKRSRPLVRIYTKISNFTTIPSVIEN